MAVESPPLVRKDESQTVHDKPDKKSDEPSQTPAKAINTPSSGPHEHHPDNNQNHICINWKRLVEWFVKLVEVCTGAAVIVTAWLIRDQLGEMEKDSVLDQRAWIGIYSAEEIASDDRNSGIFTVTVKNTGKTPALNIQNVVSFNFDTNSIMKMDGIPVSQTCGSMIPPESELHLSTETIPAQLFQKISTGSTAYIYGTVWYDDIFKHHHWSQFCFSVYRSPLNNGLFRIDPMLFHNNCDDSQ